nr:EOG090X0B7I [Ilyocryptus agilis]
MWVAVYVRELKADPSFIDQIVNKIKSQGTFDQWRRECLADVDTKPAYQNLTFRVDSSVASFLSKQTWRPNMAKNQVRENLRKHILELGIIEKGVDRIVEQVVQPKVLPLFHPAVEDAIYAFLGIEKPVAKKNGSTQQPPSSPKKQLFKPISVTDMQRDVGATPPPGEELGGLEAITPSSESSSSGLRGAKKDGLEDEVSDVSMEDVSNRQAEPLERICSPVSQNSSCHPPGEERAVSALSAISSGDDLPSSATSPAPTPPGESDYITRTSPPQNEREEAASPISESSSGEEDDDDDFSSPEFEKLEVVANADAIPIPLSEDEDEALLTCNFIAQEADEKEPKIKDDHADWRPKTEDRGPDRKPDEDPDDKPSAGPSGSTSQSAGSSATGSGEISGAGQSTDTTVERPKSSTSSSKDRERRSSHSKSSSRHKSDEKRKEKSHKDKSRDREREKDKEKRRDRDPERKRSSSKHRSDRERDGEKKKSSSHRTSERDREREKDRSRDKSDRNRSSTSTKKDRKRIPSSPPHPKSYLWKRPEEKPHALWNYLARFPDDGDDADYSDVSVSSVSSYYEQSDAETTVILFLSEVEVESEIEVELVATGAQILELDSARKQPEEEKVAEDEMHLDYKPVSESLAPASAEHPSPETAGNKRVRKMNMRYSDSYVGSEFRKIITQHSSEHVHPQHQRSPPALNNNNSNRKSELRQEYRDHGVSESPPEEPEANEVRRHTPYLPPDAKRLKTEHLPSSPESVQSDPSYSHPPVLAQSVSSPSASAGADSPSVNEDAQTFRRRSAGPKQPQQRYDDTDLYKPRPVITPSSRRSRRQDES